MISGNPHRKQRCMRTHRQLLRTKLTGKQKMAYAKRGKRKSPFQDVVFEVSDDDMSPEHHDNNPEEPEAKIMKFLNTETVSATLKISNLKDENKTSQEIITIDDSFQNEKTLDISSDQNTATETICEKTQTVGKKVRGGEVCKVSKSSHKSKKIKYRAKEDLEEGELQDSFMSRDQTDSQESVDDSSICIKFKDKITADLYKFQFIKFLESFVELEVTLETDLTLKVQRDPILKPSEWLIVDEVSLNQLEEIEEKLASPLPITPEVKPKKKKKKKTKVNKDLFMLDTNPSNESDALGMQYSSKFQLNENNEETTNVAKTFVSGVMCFNCGSQHSLKDCKLPKDYGKINAARLKMQQQKQNVRYHLEPDQKYSHLKPGKISDNLREALELRKNQLPPYIYQMRLLGYPPGWLEEAKFIHSNLDMFDSEGRTVRQANTKSLGLDPEKIVDYPGFNVPMAKNTIDEYKYYQLPQYSEKFSKEHMLEYFEKACAQQQDNHDACDMDLDTTNDDTRNNVGSSPNPNQMIENKDILKNPRVKQLKKIDACLSSPTLTELEKQKENLLAALEDSVSSNITTADATEEPENSEKCSKSNINSSLEIKINLEENTTDSEKSPTLNEKKTIKNSSFGTPILKSSSPYSRLPNPDNFMKDVSPVINFENLPNSTGKYEQMTEVLQKVRKAMKKPQNLKS